MTWNLMCLQNSYHVLLWQKKMCFGIPIYFPSLLVESFFTWTIDVSQYFFIFLPNVLTPIKVFFIHPPFDLRQLPIVNCFLSLIWWPFGPFCLLVSFTICDNPLLRNWFHGKELYKIILKVFAKRIVLLTLLIANKYLTWKKMLIQYFDLSMRHNFILIIITIVWSIRSSIGHKVRGTRH